MHQVRSLLPTNIPWAACTATATAKAPNFSIQIFSMVSLKCLCGWNCRRMPKTVSFKTGCAAVQVRSDVAENLGLKGSPLREAPPGDAQSPRASGTRFMLRRCQVLLPFDRQNLRYGVIQRTLEWAEAKMRPRQESRRSQGDVFS